MRGKRVALRSDWEVVKVGIMEQCLRSKFAGSELRSLLLSTGDAELVEGNTWNDRFWGVCRGKGQNHLGKLLMRIRSELRAPGGSSSDR
jgi:N-glycosidase YbiA